MKDLEREHILSTLREFAGSRKKTVEKLGISERTLRNHLTAIYGKLDVANRLELYMYATRHGLG